MAHYINAIPASIVSRRKQTFSTYASRADAETDMKRRRKRKYTISYTAAWGGCWIAWYNA